MGWVGVSIWGSGVNGGREDGLMGDGVCEVGMAGVGYVGCLRELTARRWEGGGMEYARWVRRCGLMGKELALSLRTVGILNQSL